MPYFFCNFNVSISIFFFLHHLESLKIVIFKIQIFWQIQTSCYEGKEGDDLKYSNNSSLQLG